MVESSLALIEEGRISTTSNDWTELLKLTTGPDRTIYIRDVTIDLNDTTTFQPRIRLLINGRPYLDDYAPANTQTKLSFGGDLKFKGKTDKPPIQILVKSAGGNTLNATAIVTGVQTVL